jgi:Flp pilus assembly pilin Flp
VPDMDRLVMFVNRLVRTDEGQDLLEYAMLVALIALVAVGAIQRVGDTINTVLWQAIAAASV